MEALMGIGWQEILLLFGILLLIFGARKLPEIGSGLGRGIQNFKAALKGGGGAKGRDDSKDD